jgi:hypothetical protein
LKQYTSYDTWRSVTTFILIFDLKNHCARHVRVVAYFDGETTVGDQGKPIIFDPDSLKN